MTLDFERMAKFAAWIAGTVMAAVLFLEGRHMLKSDAELEAAEMRQRILMSESTRYAEIAKYYTDKLKSGETLTEAEQARLDLVQRQQVKINETLTRDD